MRTLLMVLTCVLVMPAGLAGEQSVFDDYFSALPLFWKNVYPNGGETLYCGVRFGPRKNRSINVEHVYPMAWAMKAQGCRSRDECRRSSPRFNRIEADMHNFYPSRKDINKARGSSPFGMVDGERRYYGSCDFEFDPRRRAVEPRPQVRGNIARAMFHMKESYGLKFYRRQGETLQRWNREDPPDREERRRNDAIEGLQGTRNRFVDQPEKGNNLRF